ncbi:MAG: TetR/AcrR family transcriptional regulator [Polyangiales bacterium]
MPAEHDGMAQHGTAPDPTGATDNMRIRILRGAAAVFGRLGYGATSVQAILAEARVSRRTFYKIFRSKEDVLRVLFENSVSMLLSAVREADRSGKPSQERLASAVEAYIQVHARAGPLARVLLLEQFSPSSPLAKQRDAAMAAFTELLSEAIRRERLRPPDPILVHGVVAAINQIAVQTATEHPEGGWDVERAKTSMLRILRALDDERT